LTTDDARGLHEHACVSPIDLLAMPEPGALEELAGGEKYWPPVPRCGGRRIALPAEGGRGGALRPQRAGRRGAVRAAQPLYAGGNPPGAGAERAARGQGV
jgi:hypothetical protein